MRVFDLSAFGRVLRVVQNDDGSFSLPPEIEELRAVDLALKPACEPIVLARRPLSGTVAANVLAHGTGALNIDATRIGIDAGERTTIDARSGGEADRTRDIFGDGAGGRDAGERFKSHAEGRWPANVLLDEAAAAALDAAVGPRASGSRAAGVRKGMGYAGAEGDGGPAIAGSSGGASRFFYVCKASTKEREAGLEAFPRKSAGELTDREEDTAGLKSPRAGAGRSSAGRACTHPTVKPIALMRYLVRLIAPPGGLVLDPFAGSGTTGIAALLEGHDFIGIEREEEYARIAEARIAHWAEKERAA